MRGELALLTHRREVTRADTVHPYPQIPPPKLRRQHLCQMTQSRFTGVVVELTVLRGNGESRHGRYVDDVTRFGIACF